ncbi:hypothetical protein [Vibrio phage vB_VhaP_PG11]|nr:hypothetical protein [Vibrio phage vB_VhaP_PG11]
MLAVELDFKQMEEVLLSEGFSADIVSHYIKTKQARKLEQEALKISLNSLRTGALRRTDWVTTPFT